MSNQTSIREKQPNLHQTPKVAIPEKEKQLADRLRDAIGDSSVSAFGRRCGISEGAFRKYFLGASPSTDALIAIADAANVSIEWLAAGRGPKQRGAPAPTPAPASAPTPFDTQRLARAIGAVQEGLAAINRTLPPDKHAQLIEAAYELILEEEEKASTQATTSARIVKFIRLAA